VNTSNPQSAYPVNLSELLAQRFLTTLALWGSGSGFYAVWESHTKAGWELHLGKSKIYLNLLVRSSQSTINQQRKNHHAMSSRSNKNASQLCSIS